MRCTMIGLSAVLLAGSLFLASCGKQRQPAPPTEAQAPAVQTPAPAETAGASDVEKEKAKRKSSLVRLKEMGMALRIYSTDHDGKWSTDLPTLMEEKCLTAAENYVCDFTGTTPPKTPDEIRAGQCDFLYFGAGRPEDDFADDDPLACTKPGVLANGCITVLYPDGHSEIHDQVPAKVQQAIAALGKNR